MVAHNPIRALTNDVVLETASAVKKFFELCDEAEVGYVVLPNDMNDKKIIDINDSISRVANTQRILIDALSNAPDTLVESAGFQKVLSDLQTMVSMTDSAITDTYTAPDIIVKLLYKNLDIVAQQNSHIDNYVESFRIAFDENCTAILANLATKIIAG